MKKIYLKPELEEVTVPDILMGNTMDVATNGYDGPVSSKEDPVYDDEDEGDSAWDE